MATPNISLLGATYSAVAGVTLPKQGGGTATFPWVEGSQTITTNGTVDVTNLAEVVVNVSGGTPAISVVDTPDSHGGTIRTITGLDISDSTLTTADQLSQGVTAYNKLGVLLTGTGGSGGGLTQHEIHLEFTDSTDTDVEVDYDDSLIATMLTAYGPGTWMYNNKQVLEAQLDSVTFYTATIIPFNTELVDYTACTYGYAIGDEAEVFEQEWSYVTDYIAIDPSMTFSYKAYLWFYIGFYDESHNPLSALYVYSDGTQDPTYYNTGYGTLSGLKIPSTAKYVRLCGEGAESIKMSLIRTS